MAVFKELVVCGTCRVRLHDECLLPEGEREEAIRHIGEIAGRDIMARESWEMGEASVYSGPKTCPGTGAVGGNLT